MDTKYNQNPLLNEHDTKLRGSVECLGLTFEDDEARRAYFLDILREKLKDPEFRNIEGFPLGDDEDILRLSDPPYYTACPNPFIEDFIRCYGQPYDPDSGYKRESFAVDISEGKTDPIYNAHSYHTKVPHKAIMQAILHYTEPGDIILDGFAGSGMTGVAAQICSNPDPEFKQKVESDWKAEGREQPQWGLRRTILNDLGPAATFIAANYNMPFDITGFAYEAKYILQALEQECGWMYKTLHTDGKTVGEINYTVWSDVLSCPECTTELNFFEKTLGLTSESIKKEFPCPYCGAKLTKAKMERLYETYQDFNLGENIKRIKRRPSLINYNVGKKVFIKQPDEQDLAILKKIEELPLPQAISTHRIPFMHMTHQRANMKSFGITHIHHFYLPRPLQVIGNLWANANTIKDVRLRNIIYFWVEQAFWTASLLNRYRPTGYSQVNQYSTGFYYVPSQHAECSPWYMLNGKLERLIKVFQKAFTSENAVLISTQSATQSNLPDNSIDYIFTDPPFGENIYYADLNFILESWYNVWTNTRSEAIIDKAKNKMLVEYQQLMQRSFAEYYRVLKPGHWMTVIFSNARNTVWNAVQEAILDAGFMVASVQTLDKQQGSYRQVTSNAVKQDLVISIYKPSREFEQTFNLIAGTEEGCWHFVRDYLQKLQPFVLKGSKVEVMVERTNHRLFDRMVAYYVRHTVTIPLSVPDFYAGLMQRFPERDGMYFLPDQAAAYDKKRVTATEIIQPQLPVTDELSAIQWLRQSLEKKPQTFQELHPQFMKEQEWQGYEKRLELLDLLAQNFIRYENKGEVPSQIHSYLSTNYKDLRNLSKDDSLLRDKANMRWYIPDPNKVIDKERLREIELLKEFEEYKISSERQIKIFRIEAIRAGFRKAWQERNYQTILDIGRKIPENVLQNDKVLLFMYDKATVVTGNEL